MITPNLQNTPDGKALYDIIEYLNKLTIRQDRDIKDMKNIIEKLTEKLK